MGHLDRLIRRGQPQREHWLGNFGDRATDRKNDEEMIKCLENRLIVTNTFCQHMGKHIKTWFK